MINVYDFLEKCILRLQELGSEVLSISREVNAVLSEHDEYKNSFKVIYGGKFNQNKETTPQSVVLIDNKKEISAFQFTEKELETMPKKFKLLFKAGKIRASVRQRNGVYEIRCRVFGQNVTASSKILETAKKKFIQNLNNVVIPNDSKNTITASFSVFAEKWLEIKKRTTKESTYNEYVRLIEKDLKPIFKNKPLHEIKREVIQNYLFSKVDAGKLRTAHKLQLTLKCIFDLAENDYNIPSPMKKIVLPGYEKERGTPLSISEETELVKYCLTGGTASSALLVILYFGIRRSELKTMQVNETSLTFTTSKTRLGKNEVKRTIPFTPVFKRVMPYVDFEKAKNISVNTIYTVFKRLFPHRHPHELRYTFISRCKEQGVNPEVVMLWAGHEEDKDVLTSRINRRYTVYSQEYLQEEAKKVDYIVNFSDIYTQTTPKK